MHQQFLAKSPSARPQHTCLSRHGCLLMLLVVRRTGRVSCGEFRIRKPEHVLPAPCCLPSWRGGGLNGFFLRLPIASLPTVHIDLSWRAHDSREIPDPSAEPTLVTAVIRSGVPGVGPQAQKDLCLFAQGLRHQAGIGVRGKLIANKHIDG